ncbi:MAG: site-specific integrase [Rivularia sp. (in: cyanobacteria)]
MKKSDNIYQEAFNDFEPPNTTDGSYLGINKAVKKQEKHMAVKVEEAINAANARLKAANIKVRIASRGGALQLRATLPLKPDDLAKGGRKKKQYQISLGIPACLDGVITAEEEAHELGKLVARQIFQWTDKYLAKKRTRHIQTFQDILDNFEQEYFKTRKRTLKSEGTFNTYERFFRKRFDLSLEATQGNFENCILRVDSDSVKRELIKISTLVCKLFQINANFNHIKPKYKPKQRDIPNDEDIILNFHKYTEYQYQSTKLRKEFRTLWRFYRLVYGLLAVYGLRPREIFNQPDIDWFLCGDNTNNTFKVHESNKTGYREVLPFKPEWIELFELKDEIALLQLKNRTSYLNGFKQLNAICNQNSAWFIRVGVDFQPYDLRHACAIRAHLDGIPIKLAAQNLGHSVEMHTKVYQQWLSLEQRKVGFDAALKKVSELDTLRAENASLKLRYESLLIENQRLKILASQK